MSARRWVTRGPLLLSLAVLAALAAVVAGPSASLGAADQQAPVAAPNRAVIVIDNGTQRTATCVRFDETSISGVDALKRSGAAVVDQQFGTMGGAVCSINGVGCPLTGCLTCQAPAYWNYFRAVGGAGFVRSGMGASTAKVRDGDVEGWAWGSNPGAPPLPTADSVCGLRPAPPSPPPAAPPPVPDGGGLPPDDSGTGSTGSGALIGPGVAELVRPPDHADGADGSTTTVTSIDGATSTTTDADSPDGDAAGLEVVDAEEMAAAGLDNGDGEPPWWSIAAFGALAAALGAWAVMVRRRRARAS